MNADLKNSETMKNLMRAFAGESQARNRYTFAAGTAKKEGLPVVVNPGILDPKQFRRRNMRRCSTSFLRS